MYLPDSPESSSDNDSDVNPDQKDDPIDNQSLINSPSSNPIGQNELNDLTTRLRSEVIMPSDLLTHLELPIRSTSQVEASSLAMKIPISNEQNVESVPIQEYMEDNFALPGSCKLYGDIQVKVMSLTKHTGYYVRHIRLKVNVYLNYRLFFFIKTC